MISETIPLMLISLDSIKKDQQQLSIRRVWQQAIQEIDKREVLLIQNNIRLEYREYQHAMNMMQSNKNENN